MWEIKKIKINILKNKIFFLVSIFHLYLLSILIFESCGNSEDWKIGKLTPMQEYSEDDPREWQDIAKEHLPIARLSLNKGKEALLIENPDLHTSFNHYIESFGALTLDGKEIDSSNVERTNIPLNYGYIDRENIPRSDSFKIFAKCNQHDLWVRIIKYEDLVE